MKIKEVEKQLQELTVENSFMIEEKMKLETRISIYLGELAVLNSSSNQECSKCISLDNLKLEINVLNKTNKKLIDINDELLRKTNSNFNNNVLEPKNPSKLPTISPNYMSTERDSYGESIINYEETGKR